MGMPDRRSSLTLAVTRFQIFSAVSLNMTKSRSFWAAAALVSLAAMVFSAYSIYGRVTLHFSGDTIEVRPVPMPPPQEEETMEAPEPAAKADTGKEENKDKEEELKAGRRAQPAAEAEPARVKAVKTIFEYKDAKAKNVQISGSFTSWKPRQMKRKDGTWKAEVYILPGTYPFHFNVDGQKKLAPGKPKAPTGDSLITVE
jgi:hypothetical protein